MYLSRYQSRSTAMPASSDKEGRRPRRSQQRTPSLNQRLIDRHHKWDHTVSIRPTTGEEPS